EAEAEGRAVHLAHAVAVGVAHAGLVEERAGPGGIEGPGRDRAIVRRRLERVGTRHRRGAAAVHHAEVLRAIDEHGERLPHAPVAEPGTAQVPHDEAVAW